MNDRINKDKWITELYEANAGRIYRIASHILYQALGHAEDAQDMVQEVFLRALRSEDILLNHPKPEAWLVVTAKNVCSNFVRSAKRADRRREAAGRALAKKNVHSIHSYTEPYQDNTGVSDILLTLKQSLSPAEYGLMEDYCIKQQSVEEIAAATGAKGGAVRIRLWRLRRKTKKFFGEE